MHEAEIVGEKGVRRHQGPGSTVQLLDASAEKTFDFTPGDGLAAEAEAFFLAVRGEWQPLLSTENAVHVATVAAAWREAGRTGQAVDVAAFAGTFSG